MASKAAPSILSADLTISGQIVSSGDIQIDGNIEGEILSSSVTIGQTAHVKGEIAGEDIIVKGRVKGTIYGKKVHLCDTAYVEGDIVHEALAIENGSYFNGSVRREKDPLLNASIQPADTGSHNAVSEEPLTPAGIDGSEANTPPLDNAGGEVPKQANEY
ncbi:MAG: bactofilin family protein [Parvibaculales bacterium]